MSDMIIGPPPETLFERLQSKLRPRIRSDRDIFDYLTFFIAIIALVTPLILRECDRKAREPDVSIGFTYLNRLTLVNDSALIGRVVDQCNPLQTLLRTLGPDTTQGVRRFFLGQDYRQFRMTIVNKRGHPMSLRDLKTSLYDFTFPGASTNDIHGQTHVYLVENNGADVNAAPVINLAPNETKNLVLIIGTILLPEQVNTSPGRLTRCQVSAVDQTGKTILSNKTQDHMVDANNNILTW